MKERIIVNIYWFVLCIFIEEKYISWSYKIYNFINSFINLFIEKIVIQNYYILYKLYYINYKTINLKYY